MSAKLDPDFGNVPRIGGPVAKSSGRFELKLHGIPPERFIPNGDRYIIEVIDVDETVLLGQLLVVVQQQSLDPRDPQADPRVENRGIMVAVIIQVGNGHLLGLPDTRMAVYEETDEVEVATVVRHAADVPMFYKPGDVVFVDKNAKGRDLRIANREVRIVNQIDVLAHVEGVHLLRDGDSWIQVDDV